MKFPIFHEQRIMFRRFADQQYAAVNNSSSLLLKHSNKIDHKTEFAKRPCRSYFEIVNFAPECKEVREGALANDTGFSYQFLVKHQSH